MPIAGSMPIAGGLIDIEHISNAVVVAAAAARAWPGADVGSSRRSRSWAGLTWLVHAALIVGQADGFALTDAADSADVDVATPTTCRGSWASWWWGRGCR